MEVKSGYKQTDVGIIPDEWIAQSLRDITDAQRPISYGIVQTGPNVENGIPCLRVVDIEDGSISKTELICTTPQISDSYRRTVVKTGDLVMPLRGKVGDIGEIDEELAGANLTRGVALLAIRTGLNGPYCRHALSWQATRRRLEQSMNGSALQEIPIATLRSFRIALPPTEVEQRAIATALGDVDSLLRGLERIFAKKRDVTQAAMQQLLTGQTRLRGFQDRSGYKQTEVGAIPKDWKACALGEGIALLSGQHVLAQHCNTRGEGMPYLTGPADFPEGTIAHTKFTDKPSTKCEPGDILVTVKGSGSGTLAMADAVYCISRQLMAIRVREWDKRFVYYSLRQSVSQINAASTGLIPGLSRSDILERLIPVPALPEQRAIAAVLSDMSAELAALEARRDKMRVLKQAMMQELLTGKTRLVQSELVKREAAYA